MSKTRAALVAVGLADVLYRLKVREIVRSKLGMLDVACMSNAQIDEALS